MCPHARFHRCRRPDGSTASPCRGDNTKPLSCARRPGGRHGGRLPDAPTRCRAAHPCGRAFSRFVSPAPPEAPARGPRRAPDGSVLGGQGEQAWIVALIRGLFAGDDHWTPANLRQVAHEPQRPVNAGGALGRKVMRDHDDRPHVMPSRRKFCSGPRPALALSSPARCSCRRDGRRARTPGTTPAEI